MLASIGSNTGSADFDKRGLSPADVCGAARWCAQHGDLLGAVEHAAAVHAWDEVARIVIGDLAVAEVILDGPGGRVGHLLAGVPRHPGRRRV